MTTDYTQPRLTLEDMRAKLLELMTERDEAHALLDGYCIPAGTLPQRIIRLQNNGIDKANWGIKWKKRAMVTTKQLKELDERYCELASLHGLKRRKTRRDEAA